MLTFRPGAVPGGPVRETAVIAIQLLPNLPDHVFVVTKSPQVMQCGGVDRG